MQYTALALFAALLVVNLAALSLFRHDKRMAVSGGRRTSEARLLMAALLGPFGAWYAMRVYRHKTRKAKFWLVPAFMGLQVFLITFLALSRFG